MDHFSWGIISHSSWHDSANSDGRTFDLAYLQNFHTQEPPTLDFEAVGCVFSKALKTQTKITVQKSQWNIMSNSNIAIASIVIVISMPMPYA
jgi:hypothetical protein